MSYQLKHQLSLLLTPSTYSIKRKNNRSMCLPRKVLVLNSGKKIGGGNLYCISCHAPARRNPST
ncbi:hypothetical protein PCASD_25300 [Puccinia coronata f. sp. avenae]|uniref:Uncharacterized protein n=1 Tax=Puccinia coronata f. sp. avenae TaxID=200324 RepID=A0A2N5TIB4_9BASI|nr:hypothetical protein PCASD_25300 [Puccinia coronata f. sp. avenae]